MMPKEIIKEFKSGNRLDKELARLRAEYSRSAIEKLINNGDITVNGERVRPKYLLKSDDKIFANFHQLDKKPEEIELTIVYEDENVVAVDKPSGVLSHSKGSFNKEGTVASWLLGRVEEVTDLDTNSNRIGIVHRLDRATSGVMICAKNKMTLSSLGKQFSKRNVKKVYHTIVSGTLPRSKGLIDIPIERNPKKPATFRAGVNGKEAQTTFEVMETFIRNNKEFSLVKLMPTTGRTHQLRVHMEHLKAPIVGDTFYGGDKAGRLMLHASSLEITLPGGNRQVLTAKLPAEFREFYND